MFAALAVALKLAVFPFPASAGVSDKTADAVTEAVVAELRKAPGVSVIGRQELAAVLSHEQQAELVGCSEGACAVELGGALGVDRLVVGSVALVGVSFLVHLKLVDAKTAATLAQTDRRLRGGSLDDVLDALPKVVGELLGSQPQEAPAVSKKPMPPATGDEPYGDLAKDALTLATDGKGNYLAFARAGGLDGPLFAGDGKAFYAQRIAGAGANGDDFDYVFWDPRAKAPWQASFAVKGGKPVLYCGEKPATLALVPAAEAKALVAKAAFYKPRWKRRAHAIARDDDATYYFVDQAREPEDNADFRLFVGAKGKLAYVEVTDYAGDDGELFLTPQGKLALGKDKAEWVRGSLKTPLKQLDLESQARFAYTQLGVYAGERLGTPCDGKL